MKLKAFLLLLLFLGAMGMELSFFLSLASNKVYLLAAEATNDQCKNAEDCPPPN